MSYNAGNSVTNPTQIYYDRHTLIYPEGMGWLRDRENQYQNQIPYYIAYTPGTNGWDYEHGRYDLGSPMGLGVNSMADVLWRPSAAVEADSAAAGAAISLNVNRGLNRLPICDADGAV